MLQPGRAAPSWCPPLTGQALRPWETLTKPLQGSPSLEQTQAARPSRLSSSGQPSPVRSWRTAVGPQCGGPSISPWPAPGREAGGQDPLRGSGRPRPHTASPPGSTEWVWGREASCHGCPQEAPCSRGTATDPDTPMWGSGGTPGPPFPCSYVSSARCRRGPGRGVSCSGLWRAPRGASRPTSRCPAHSPQTCPGAGTRLELTTWLTGEGGHPPRSEGLPGADQAQLAHPLVLTSHKEPL